MAKIKAKADECASTAFELTKMNIPYVYGGTSINGMDCRGLVLYVLRSLGVVVRFSGATDLYDNYLSYRAPIGKAKAEGKLVPGALLFHIAGTTAEHVGWYTGIKGAEVAHASQSRKSVVTSPLSNYYTHAGLSSHVDYSGNCAGGDFDIGGGVSDEDTVTVIKTNVRIRKQPEIIDGKNHNRITTLPDGYTAEIIERKNGWTRIPYLNHIGWVRDDMLRFN